MSYDIKQMTEKPLIIEFVGLPGCGKSTVVESILPILQNEKVIITRSDFSRTIGIMRRYPILAPFVTMYYLTKPKYRELKSNLFRFALQFPIKKQGLIYVVYVIVLYELIQKNINRSKIIILDEGIIQFLSSIPHDISIDNNILLHNLVLNLKSVLGYFLFVECDLSIETVIERIKKRNRQDRFSHDNNNIRSLLLTKKNNLNLLTNEIAMQKIQIDMSNPVDFNVNIILKSFL